MTTGITFLCLLSLASGAALAHPGDHADGVARGFAHPFLGLDHLPAVFVTFMGVGAMAGGLPLPVVER